MNLDREQKLYQIFEADYERRKPQPQQKNRMIMAVMVVSLIASLLLSSMTTIPAIQFAFRAQWAMGTLHDVISLLAGFLGWILIDVLVFVATYWIVSAHYTSKTQIDNLDLSEIMKAMGMIAIFGGITSILTNILIIYDGYGVIDKSTGVGWVISLLVATFLSLAPFITQTAAGAVLALLPLTYAIEIDEYESKKDRAWAIYKKRRGIADNLDNMLHENFMKPVKSHRVHEIIHEVHEPMKPKTPARQRVHDFLNAHDHPNELSLKEISEQMGGVSLGLISEEKNAWLKTKS